MSKRKFKNGDVRLSEFGHGLLGFVLAAVTLALLCFIIPRDLPNLFGTWLFSALTASFIDLSIFIATITTEDENRLKFPWYLWYPIFSFPILVGVCYFLFEIILASFEVVGEQEK